MSIRQGQLRNACKRITVYLVVLCAAVLGTFEFGAAAFAQSKIDPQAEGLTEAIVACDFTADGLVVAFVNDGSRWPGGLSVNNGDPCLPNLAMLNQQLSDKPPALVHFGDGASFNAVAPNALVWVIDLQSTMGAIVGCVAEGGVLKTRIVDVGTSPAYTPATDEHCLTTLKAFEAMGGRAIGPTAATLSINGTGVGTLLFTNTGRPRGFGFVEMPNASENVVEVVGCGLDHYGKLIAKFHESSKDGVVAVKPDQSCAITITGFQKYAVRQPTSATKHETSDPGCLIWDIAGGTIGQNN